MIKCPNCGRERLVVEGKRKKCRKCGTPLTSRPPKEKPSLSADDLQELYPRQIGQILDAAKAKTVDELQEQYPEQVAEIIKAAQALVVKEEIGELTSELLLEHYPELVAELTAAAKETAAKETAEAIAKDTAEKVRTKIGKMSVKKFAEQFSELHQKLVKAIRGQKTEDRGQRTENT